jgi:hypothetical protein
MKDIVFPLMNMAGINMQISLLFKCRISQTTRKIMGAVGSVVG